MATVTSFTAQRILELMSGWEGTSGELGDLAALVTQLQAFMEQNRDALNELNVITLPQLIDRLAENEISVSNLNDNVLPQLTQSLADSEAAIEDMATVTIPNLQTMVNSNAQNIVDAPKVYVQPDEPTNPDVDGRTLVNGDTWFDSDDQNKQRMWNGAIWTTYAVDIPDLSLTVQKFKVNTHMIY